MAKAQSDGNIDVVSDGSGMVGGVYLPRRTSQRRISHALALSLDSTAAKPRVHNYYSPFLRRPERASGTHPPNGEMAQRKDATKQVLWRIVLHLLTSPQFAQLAQ